MKTLTIQAVRAQLESLVDAAGGGEEIIISKAGVPTARLMPLAAKKPDRRFGTLKGTGTVADDFDAPLPPDILAEFEGD